MYMNLDELKAIDKPKRRLKGTVKDLITCILARIKKEHVKKVYPGKGLTGSEIRARMRNRSFVPDGKGLSYSDEKGVEAVKSMSRIDLMRSSANEKPKIDQMKKDLDKKFAAGRKKHEEDAIAKRIKDAKDGKE